MTVTSIRKFLESNKRNFSKQKIEIVDRLCAALERRSEVKQDVLGFKVVGRGRVTFVDYRKCILKCAPLRKS